MRLVKCSKRNNITHDMSSLTATSLFSPVAFTKQCFEKKLRQEISLRTKSTCCQVKYRNNRRFSFSLSNLIIIFHRIHTSYCYFSLNLVFFFRCICQDVRKLFNIFFFFGLSQVRLHDEGSYRVASTGDIFSSQRRSYDIKLTCDNIINMGLEEQRIL